MITIPENLTEFLYWVKNRTETFWSINPKTTSNDFACEEWIYGAKWIGLSESQIDNIEIKYSVKFTPEHREFLKILHTIDRKETREYTDSFEENAKVLTKEVPFFYNWLEDETEIRRRLDWPFNTIYEDVIGSNRVWLKSWGKRPSSEAEIKNIYTDWYNKIPSLLPLTSHRFLVSEPSLEYNPVLSIYGSDIIVYGWNLRGYLLKELCKHLGLYKLVYDDEDKCYYAELLEEVQAIFNADYVFDERKVIPNIQEMILFWTSAWSTFGLKLPQENDGTIQPIMKTYIADDEDNNQKQFTDF
jgi:hypothetical protein